MIDKETLQLTLSNEQHNLVEFLYNSPRSFHSKSDLPDNISAPIDNLSFLSRKNLIVVKDLGLPTCKYRIAPQGMIYYENFLKQIESENETREYKNKILQETILGNQLSEEANRIAKEAKRKAHTANIIAVISLLISSIISLVSLILSILL